MPPDKAWFYFNGFNSAIPDDYSDNDKIVAVAGWARRLGYRFRPVSVNYRQARTHCSEILSEARAVRATAVFSGSSMGGWFARVMQLKFHEVKPALPSACVSFNPAYDLAIHGHLLEGPQCNHVTGELYEWTAEHSRQLAALESEIDYDLALPFYVYTDKGDEVIGWNGSAARHRQIADFTAFEGGCHSFEHYHEALEHFAGDFGK
jgi:predicted esterase YcpF (UPF0227 family)